MNCQKIKKLLIPFLDSELPDNLKKAIESHLHQCHACREEKILLEKTWSLLDKVNAPDISPDFSENLMAKIHQQQENQPKFIFTFPKINIPFEFRFLIPAMASFCIIMALSYLFLQNHSMKSQQMSKDLLLEQYLLLEKQKDSPSDLQMDVAKIIPTQQEEVLSSSTEKDFIETAKITPTQKEEKSSLPGDDFIKEEKSEIAAMDEEIIRNLEIYENIELYKNYTLLNELDIVENLDAKVL